MKKTFLTFCLISIFSFSFFSCASKEAAPENQTAAPETEITEEPSEEENTEEVTNQAESEDSNTEEDTDLVSEETESQTETTDDYFDLPEIIEPEVFEAELPPLPEVPEGPSAPAVIITEPLTDEDTVELPELPQDEPEAIKEEETEEPSEVTDSTDSADSIDSNDSTDGIDEVIELNNSHEDEVVDLESPDESSSDENAGQEEVPEATVQIVPSRSVSMKKGESLDVVYPGKGWIFLGCTDGSKNLTSTGRKTGDKNTSFTLMARVSGTVILHFYKEDILGEQYIDDYLEVTVSEIKSKPSVHVKAPDYAEAVPKKPVPAVSEQKKTETDVAEAEPVHKEEKPPVKESKPSVQSYSNKTAVEPEKKAEPAPEKMIPETEEVSSYKLLSGEEYMTAARKALDEKNFTEVYNNLQNFLTVSDKNRDEALFLLAKLYEGNSEYKNIKKSVETYEELIQNYPLSSHWEEAEKRVIYLKRFYINIR